jgi:L-asparaginase / beta-aspartyl-peptidase
LTDPVVVIHAGAGDNVAELREHAAEACHALTEALEAARSALAHGAVHAVEAATVVMENFELFNAGRGSVLCSDGSIEMSAALMRGDDQAAGAVAGLQHTENPIVAAHIVLESPQVLMAGPLADELAARAGVAQQPNEHFMTPRQRSRRGGAAEADRATVGAVCLDAEGTLAAATSTGGVRGQPPGRVGDCPVIGAGTWADRWAAISCTGDGEAFIRCAAAREVAALVREGMVLSRAAEEALSQVAELQARGGLIAVDAGGNVAMPFITGAMPRGMWRMGEEPQVWIP